MPTNNTTPIGALTAARNGMRRTQAALAKVDKRKLRYKPELKSEYEKALALVNEAEAALARARDSAIASDF